ncbi:MAG: hypothetical protein ACMXYD_03045 [Candidatus Woesearchaeota archaeon]
MKSVSEHYKLVLLILLALTAAQIQPETTTVDAQIGESFSEILTVTNTLARPAEYTLRLHPFAQYLTEAVSIQEETLFLRPQESKNFQISATIPPLGPETHKLIYELVEDQRVVANSTIHIPIAGTPNLEASLTASTETIREGQTLPVHIELTNFGNVIAYYRVQIQILQGDEQLGSVTYPQQLQVLPGEQERIILPYTDELAPGAYVLVVEATVNEQQELLVQEPFVVSENQQALRVRAGEVLQVDLAEQNLSIPVEELEFLNESVNTSAFIASSEYLLRKSVSNTLAVPGEPVRVSLQLYNFQPSLRSFTLVDSLPAGFRSSEELVWSGEVPARGSTRITYDAFLEDTVLAGIDSYPRAEATIGSSVVYSNPVPFIRQYVSKQSLYVQKRVSHVSDEVSSVTLTVRNLGESSLSDITIRELLSDSAEFSQMTQQPEMRGLWVIDSLSPDGVWEVSYITDSGDSRLLLPSVYGVSSDVVLRTLVVENVVNEAWNFVRTRSVEIIGLLLLVLVPVILVVGRKRNWFGL